MYYPSNFDRLSKRFEYYLRKYNELKQASKHGPALVGGVCGKQIADTILKKPMIKF